MLCTGSGSELPAAFTSRGGATAGPRGDSPYFRSQTGRVLRTIGTTSKLCGGGGEVVAHSSVWPSQGSFSAIAPLRRVRRTLIIKTRMPRAIVNAPSVETQFQKSKPIPRGQV